MAIYVLNLKSKIASRKMEFMVPIRFKCTVPIYSEI